MLEQKKILIVEDNLDFAHDLAVSFQNGGFETFHAEDVDSAIEILRMHRIDGMTLDIQLKSTLGINLVDKIHTQQIELIQTPVIIVVSSFINPQVLQALKKYQVLHYDKSAPGFNYTMILDTFTSLLGMFTSRETTQKTEEIHETNLKVVIRQKLEPYGFKVKAKGYARLVEGIYHTILTDGAAKQSLTSIYEDLIGIEFSTAFIGMKRLLHETFASSDEVPTPADFIHKIAEEIKKDLPLM